LDLIGPKGREGAGGKEIGGRQEGRRRGEREGKEDPRPGLEN